MIGEDIDRALPNVQVVLKLCTSTAVGRRLHSCPHLCTQMTASDTVALCRGTAPMEPDGP